MKTLSLYHHNMPGFTQTLNTNIAHNDFFLFASCNPLFELGAVSLLCAVLQHFE